MGVVAEVRGGGDRGRSNVGRLLYEGASVLMEYDHTTGGGGRGGRRNRRDISSTKNISATVK